MTRPPIEEIDQKYKAEAASRDFELDYLSKTRAFYFAQDAFSTIEQLIAYVKELEARNEQLHARLAENRGGDD